MSLDREKKSERILIEMSYILAIGGTVSFLLGATFGPSVCNSILESEKRAARNPAPQNTELVRHTFLRPSRSFDPMEDLKVALAKQRVKNGCMVSLSATEYSPMSELPTELRVTAIGC